MFRFAICALVLSAAMAQVANANAAARDGATVVDSGSTNTAGYRIEVWSDGTASIVMQNRAGVAQSAARPFSVATRVTARFFADLKGAKAANVSGSPCMKSASFGTTTRVSWHGWTSPDLDCPSENALLSAVIHDVNLIRAASGIDSMPGVHRGADSGGPIRVEPPSPSPAASPPKR